MAQRLLEIESYLMQALLTYPLARRTMPMLGHADQELAKITEAIASATTAEEPALLDQLTKLAATIESIASSVPYRITAAQAYYELVQRRISELREWRVEAAKAVNLPINPDLAIGISIPVVALLVALGVRKIRRMVSQKHGVD